MTPSTPPARPFLLALVPAALAALLAGCGSGLPPTPTSPTWSTAASASALPATTTTVPPTSTTPPPSTVLAADEVGAVVPVPRRALAAPRTTTTTTTTTARPTTTKPTTTKPTTPKPPSTRPTPPHLAGGPLYRSCAEAKAAGAAPIHRGQPGYRPGLDRNKNGVACEE